MSRGLSTTIKNTLTSNAFQIDVLVRLDLNSNYHLFVFRNLITPLTTITRVVPRIPMSRLFMSIDFITDPLIRV